MVGSLFRKKYRSRFLAQEVQELLLGLTFTLGATPRNTPEERIFQLRRGGSPKACFMPHIAPVLKKEVNFHLELIQLMVLHDMTHYDNSILKSKQERWGISYFSKHLSYGKRNHLPASAEKSKFCGLFPCLQSRSYIYINTVTCLPPKYTNLSIC